jgi:hypothetical protein
MPKYQITITETVKLVYEVFDVEADNENDARKFALDIAVNEEIPVASEYVKDRDTFVKMLPENKT